MPNRIEVDAAQRGVSRGLTFFAGETLRFEVSNRPAGAEIVVTLGAERAGAPLIEATGADLVTLDAAALAPLPEGQTCHYNVWQRLEGDLTLLRHGAVTARSSMAPEGTGTGSGDIQPLAITGTPPLSAQEGVAYSFQPGTSGGLPPLAFDLAAGDLPAGLALDPATGVLDGTPTEAGSFEGIALRVTDTAGTQASLPDFDLTVASGSVATTFTASDGGPRLILDGDSTIAYPGFRDAVLWALGDVTWTPDDFQQATGGHNLQHLLDTAPAVVDLVVPGETIVVIGPIGANGDNSTDDAGAQAKLAAVYDLYLDAGAVVVAVPTLPDGYDAGDPPYLFREQRFEALRAVTADYAANEPNFHAVDISGFDPVTMKSDQTHPNIENGAAFLANLVRGSVLPLVTGSRLDTVQNLMSASRAALAGDTATGATNVTGIQPEGYSFVTFGDGNWTVSRNGDGDLVVACADAPAGGASIFQMLTDVTTPVAEGDILDAIFEVEVDPASTGFGGIASAVEESSVLGLAGATAFETLPDWPLYARSRGAVQQAHSARNVLLRLACAPGGSASFTVKRAAMFHVANVADKLSIGGTPSTVVQVGDSYAFTPAVTGGTAPYAYELAAGSLPAGLSLDPATGTIAGSPTTIEVQGGLALRVTDDAEDTATLAPFTLWVTAAGAPVLSTAPAASDTTPEEGQTLTFTMGTWSNSPTAYAYEIRSSGHVVATGTTTDASVDWVVPADTAPQTLRVEVVASNASGDSAPAASPETAAVADTIAGGGSGGAIAAWDSSATDYGGVTWLAYSDEDRTVRAAPGIGGSALARGLDPLTGKVFFGIEIVSQVGMVGLCDDSITITTGALGTARVGKSGGIVYYSGGQSFVGTPLAAGQVGWIAADIDAGTFWIRQDDGDWNGDAGADPASGTGGFSLGGLTGPVHALVQLSNDTSAEARLLGTADLWGAVTPPAGFAPIA